MHTSENLNLFHSIQSRLLGRRLIIDMYYTYTEDYKYMHNSFCMKINYENNQ